MPGKFNETDAYTTEGVAAAQAALIAAKNTHGTNHPAFKAALKSYCAKVNVVLEELGVDGIRF